MTRYVLVFLLITEVKRWRRQQKRKIAVVESRFQGCSNIKALSWYEFTFTSILRSHVKRLFLESPSKAWMTIQVGPSSALQPQANRTHHICVSCCCIHSESITLNKITIPHYLGSFCGSNHSKIQRCFSFCILLLGWLRLFRSCEIRTSEITMWKMLCNESYLVANPTSQSLPEVGRTPAQSLLLQDKPWTCVCNCVWCSGSPFGQSGFLLSERRSHEWPLFQVQNTSEPEILISTRMLGHNEGSGNAKIFSFKLVNSIRSISHGYKRKCAKKETFIRIL